MLTPRVALAVVLAGMAGTIANSVVVAVALGIEVIPLTISPGRNLVAIAVACALPILFHRVGGIAAWVAGLAFLTVVPSVLAKLVFGVGAAWPFVLAVNGVYAIAATAVFVAIAGPGRAATKI
ncbi:MAG: hypothetical protein ACFBWO_05530 [Paracoccaceae bacterium]